jgi:hypothetical protein
MSLCRFGKRNGLTEVMLSPHQDRCAKRKKVPGKKDEAPFSSAL